LEKIEKKAIDNASSAKGKGKALLGLHAIG